MYCELLLGCGHRRTRDFPDNKPFKNLVTLDNNPDCNPNWLWDLEELLPFQTDWFDEIHAYDVLEHLHSQGDEVSFFSEWSEYARILKPNGIFVGSVPRPDCKWAYGDPGHKRIITSTMLSFLNQDMYKQVGKTKCSDYRHLWKYDLKLITEYYTDDTFYFILKKEGGDKYAVKKRKKKSKS